MTPVHGAVVVYRLGVWRVLFVVVLCLFLFYRYFVAPVIEGIDRFTPWDGVVPGSFSSCGATPPTPSLAGFPAMWYDLGAGVRKVASGPPSAAQMSRWFSKAGESSARSITLVRNGAAGKPEPIPLAPLAPSPAPLQVSCSEVPTGTWVNGQMPDNVLVVMPGGRRLRNDAASAFTGLSSAYTQAFGTPLKIGSGYRSYGEQAALKRAKPYLAASAGKSQHGEGLAADINGPGARFGTSEHEWLRANAGQFGWVHPGWAQRGGSKPEPWHWEYVGVGVTMAAG